MNTSAAAPWLLALALLGLLMTVTALVRADRLGWGNMFWFLSGWLTSELALFHVAISGLVLAAFALATDALRTVPGRIALALILLSWAGLALAQWRARPTGRVLEQALQAGLGSDYRATIPPARRAVLRESVPLRELVTPFALRTPGVAWVRNIAYADGHQRHVLDVYRPAGDCSQAPVLLQIHGGAWMLGNKHEQALPLVYHLAARGWVVVTPNYRLSPRARFPDHLVDCKRALAWVRQNIAGYGGDPNFIAVTGGSAGGHLTALMALTANDARLQPGFEDVDTTVAAAVPFYGVYDFTDRHGLKGSGASMVRWLEQTVMPCSPLHDPELWDLASPIAQLRRDAPPFFILHGTHDSLAGVEEARHFASRLRATSMQPVVYAELPGAQHAWDIFRSVRAMESVHAVARFLEWTNASTRSCVKSNS
ncbi:MAG: alpha/beta hydrolase [Steroidobacteraceae bacterium]|nr:alpha/beta hydrolase [Steroidobacteraceae bacterium]